MITKDGKEIITGIRAGYVIAFNPKKRTISFFKKEKLHPLYFDTGSIDDQLSAGFIRKQGDFVKLVLLLADIKHLTPRPFEFPDKRPAWIFRKRQGKEAPKPDKAGRVRGSKDSLLESL